MGMGEKCRPIDPGSYWGSLSWPRLSTAPTCSFFNLLKHMSGPFSFRYTLLGTLSIYRPGQLRTLLLRKPFLARLPTVPTCSFLNLLIHMSDPSSFRYTLLSTWTWHDLVHLFILLFQRPSIIINNRQEF